MHAATHTDQLQGLLALWFRPETQVLWFNATEEFDQRLRRDYEALVIEAADGALDTLIYDDTLALALVILLDQVPLNIYRHDARRYASADRALAIAAAVIARGGDQAMSADQKSFLYMPYMHSEVLAHQDIAIQLYTDAGLAGNARFARHHRDIIARFGRFPHRNRHLGRDSTADEIAWLASDAAFKA